MKTLNFVVGGHTGDLLHTLYVVNNICIKEDAKANLYIVDHSYSSFIEESYNFSFYLEKIYNDLKDLIYEQKYINKFEILSRDFNENFINLNIWRKAIHITGWKSWTDLLNENYKINFLNKYNFLDIKNVDQKYKNSIIVHHSDRRKNDLFNWNKILQTNEEIFFLTTNSNEYDVFAHKTDNLKPIFVSTVIELASIIKGCKLFIGNQSMPLALASALDVPRIALLFHVDAIFYMNEHSYSNNISWFLSNERKHNSINIGIKI